MAIERLLEEANSKSISDIKEEDSFLKDIVMINAITLITYFDRET
jgi:hypothetical protein